MKNNLAILLGLSALALVGCTAIPPDSNQQAIGTDISATHEQIASSSPSMVDQVQPTFTLHLNNSGN
jgi:starvation-inducible outer membrane lipoprotein